MPAAIALRKALSPGPRARITHRIRLGWRAYVARPLPSLMLIAILLRAWAALTPGFHHPDAIYQYLEPAYRLLGGDGVVTWEWRTGIRSWLVPALLAGPLALGEAIDPIGSLPMILPRLATAIASLGIVWAGWDIGRRHDPVTGLLTGFVAATWFELVFFAAETLAEPLATAAIIPAAALATCPRMTAGKALAAGALLGFAALARPHYAPAGAAIVLVSWSHTLSPTRFDGRRWVMLIVGAMAVALGSAAIDLMQGLTPFAWILENFQQNIVHNVSARYGTFPGLSYVAWFMEVWRWWMIPATIGVLFGWRQCPGLLAAAAVTLVIHSLIPHKEYRFIFLGIAILVLLAAMGWGAIIGIVRHRWGAVTGIRAATGIFTMWILASAVLAQGNMAPGQLKPNTDGWNTFARLRADPTVCGVGLIVPASFANMPGAVALRQNTPLSMFWTDDPALDRNRPWATAARREQDFNRIVTVTRGRIQPPEGWHIEHCEQQWTDRMCILARAGSCRKDSQSPFEINRAMARLGL